jgi:hypothetical protein
MSRLNRDTKGDAMISAKPKSKIFRTVPASALICFTAIALAPGARADQWDKKTILTVGERIQVRNTVLEPGQYVFKLLDSQSDRHIVQIFNADQSRIIDTELAIPNYRLQPTGHSRFTFWETPAGRAKALRAWFYPGDNFGQEFAYPKQLAMARETAASVTVRHETEVVTPAPVEAPPAVSEQSAAPVPATPAESEPTLVAQNTPPPAPPSATPAPAAPPAENTPALPRTASPVPAIGLGGLLSLGCFAVLRRRQVAG